MAKVHPTAFTSSPYMTSKKETFTIWMKSLVHHGNGCTVYNTNGEIVYRVDNYDKKCSNEVYLMDLQGRVLCTIRRKKLRVFGHWNGYRWSYLKGNMEKPWFQVKKNWRILMGDLACQITVRCDKAKASCYWIVRLAGKVGFRIVDIDGAIVAEVKRKQSSSGIMLGDDVLTMVVEPKMDHSLIMAIVTVYGLINHKM